MVSGMIYSQEQKARVFAFTNFRKIEMQNGTFESFIERLHPILKQRYEIHLEMLKSRRVLASELDIAKASQAGAHGEVRALDALLKYLESNGVEVTDDTLGSILCFNKSIIRTGGNPPRCVHCWHLTDKVKMVGND